MKDSVPDQKRKLPEPDRADFASTRLRARYINVPHWSQTVTTTEKKGLYARACRQKHNNRTIKKTYRRSSE